NAATTFGVNAPPPANASTARARTRGATPALVASPTSAEATFPGNDPRGDKAPASSQNADGAVAAWVSAMASNAARSRLAALVGPKAERRSFRAARYRENRQRLVSAWNHSSRARPSRPSVVTVSGGMASASHRSAKRKPQPSSSSSLLVGEPP